MEPWLRGREEEEIGKEMFVQGRRKEKRGSRVENATKGAHDDLTVT
jgi:hypothetical protein